MTKHPTTAKIWLANRILYLHRQCKEGLITFEQYETMVAQARLDKEKLEIVENSEHIRINLPIGTKKVLVMGLLTDANLTPYVQFKLRNATGSPLFDESFDKVRGV